MGHLRGWSDPRCVSKTSVDTIISLALEGNHLCRLLAGQGAVPALIDICTGRSAAAEVRVAALRALGSVCCVPEGIAEFEAGGGPDLVVGLLSDRTAAEEERSEAAGVLAQVTSPWIETADTSGYCTAEVVAALTGEALIIDLSAFKLLVFGLSHCAFAVWPFILHF